MELMKLAYLFLFVAIPYSFGKLVDMGEYQDMVVDMHNTFRRKISAADMREIVWDSHLADKAGYWSKWCTYERHNNKHHNKYGENLFVGKIGDTQKVIFDGLQDWYDQGESYNYQPFQTRCGDTCEYTQLVWANTAKLGCAMNKCGRLFNGYQTLQDVMLFVCFYQSRGNIPSEFPYQAGIECSDCQQGTACRDNLCSEDFYETVPISRTVNQRSDDQDKLPQDSEWTENPAYMYAEGRPTSRYTNYVDRRRYPDDLRYRRTQQQQQLRRRQQEEERRRQEEDERRRQQEEKRRRQQEDERRRQQDEERRRRQDEDKRQRRQEYEVRRTPVHYKRRRPQSDPKQTPPNTAQNYARRQYSYTDEYSRVCSCECRRNSPAPYTSPRGSYVSPIRQYKGDLTQPERYELISVHNLMRDERKLPRIHWNAELEKWTTYIIRCDTEFPGPRHTYTNFGKMVENEDVYTFVHAWGSEGDQVNGREKHCRATDNNTNCNRYNNLMRAEIKGFACATSRCTSHRQIVCLYR